MGYEWRRGRPLVRNRHDDDLARLDPLEFERVVADMFRGQGYEVEHCGTGGGPRRFDGGIDLKLYRDGQYVLVQCKRENVLQVTHNVGHELLGILITERADRAIVVNSGEFTSHAWVSAEKAPQLELIDGDSLRSMLSQPALVRRTLTDARVGTIADVVTSPDRLSGSETPQPRLPVRPRVSTVDRDRPRHLDRARRGSHSRRGRARRTDGAKVLVAFAFLLGLAGWQCARDPAQQRAAPQPHAASALPAGQARPLAPARQAPAASTTSAAMSPPRAMTPEQERAAARRAAEAIKVIERDTPEM